ncbi:MAG: hydrogenase maturation protease [Candidatus Binatia bacterium]
MMRVIGIGSPCGDDRIGLVVAAKLRTVPLRGVEVVLADRPGIGLMDALADAGAVILIDAVRAPAPAGSVYDLDLEAVSDAPVAPVSSHSVGVAETLALARALGRLPPRGRLIGIVIDGVRPTRDGLSPQLACAVDEAVQRVRAWITFFAAARSYPGSLARDEQAR